MQHRAFLRSRDDFDVNACNAELDQDLEGALRAIEGEEQVRIISGHRVGGTGQANIWPLKGRNRSG